MPAYKAPELPELNASQRANLLAYLITTKECMDKPIIFQFMQNVKELFCKNRYSINRKKEQRNKLSVPLLQGVILIPNKLANKNPSRQQKIVAFRSDF